MQFCRLKSALNTPRPKQNDLHSVDDIFKYIFLDETVVILQNKSLKFVPKGPIYN